MQTAQQSILQLFFGKENLSEVDRGEIGSMIANYPYVGALRYLMAAKSKESGTNAITDEQVTAGLYVNNPLWLNLLLNAKTEDQPTLLAFTPDLNPLPINIGDPSTGQAEQTDEPIAFQSYHTIDYFASQGIRLQQEDLAKDKFGQQLRSFTDWLRSMKKLPAGQQAGESNGVQDETNQKVVIQSAAHSIEGKEIVTEAMAEVWAKQGNSQKARTLYEKLSLQNPSKSAYFAAKIDQLK